MQRKSVVQVFLLTGLAVLLSSCGGDDSPKASSETAGSPASPASPGTGRLLLLVTDTDGLPLEAVRVNVLKPSAGYLQQPQETDRQGRVLFTALPAEIELEIIHPLGNKRTRLPIPQDGTTESSVVVSPHPDDPVAMFPATVLPGSLSADQTELEIHLTLAGSARTEYPFSVSDELAFPDPEQSIPGEVLKLGPLLRLEDCAFQPKVWRNQSGASPDCYRKSFVEGAPEGNQSYSVAAVHYAYLPAAVPAPLRSQDPYSVLLLLDQSAQVLTADPERVPVHSTQLRTYAVKHFVREVLGGSRPNQAAVAGFAGSGSLDDLPLLLPESPLWSTGLSMDKLALESRALALESMFGGTAPVFDALQSAMSRVVEQVPASSRRAVVAFLGGGDNSVLTASERNVRLASLRQSQGETGIQALLVAPKHYVTDRSGRIAAPGVQLDLAEVAAALRAPLIFNPGNWPGNSPYAEAILAADILSGSAMPTIEMAFRLKSNQAGGFVRGSRLSGTLWVVEGDQWWGYVEWPMPFVAEIP
jgi:hypothetical protein